METSVMSTDILCRNLADEINLVGLKAIYNTKQMWVKLFWVMFIIIGSSATSYYLIKTVEEFNEERTVMKVS